MTGRPPEQELREAITAIREGWCNGCKRPLREWGPVCGGMTTGDMTHFHSPEWWASRIDRAADRLVAERDEARQALQQHGADFKRHLRAGTADVRAQRDAAEARVAALQQALEAIARSPDAASVKSDIARAALAGVPAADPALHSDEGLTPLATETLMGLRKYGGVVVEPINVTPSTDPPAPGGPPVGCAAGAGAET